MIGTNHFDTTSPSSPGSADTDKKKMTSESAASGTATGNPFDQPQVQPHQTRITTSPDQQQHQQQLQQNNGGAAGSPRSVTNAVMTESAAAGIPLPPGTGTTASPAPATTTVVAASNPFDDAELLRSVGLSGDGGGGGGGAPPPPPAGGPQRPPLAGSTNNRSMGHRSARTMCTSELSSLAAQAAGSLGTDPFAAGGASNAGGSGYASSPLLAPGPPGTPPLTNDTSAPPLASSSSDPTSPQPPNKETARALSELAAALSSVRPRCNTAEEDVEEAAAVARVTLGLLPEESTGTPKSHRRTLSGKGVGGGSPKLQDVDKNVRISNASAPKPRGHRRTASVEKVRSMLRTSASPLTSPVRHRKSASLGGGMVNMADMLDVVDSINEAGGGTRENKDYGSRKGIFGIVAKSPKSPGGRKSPGSKSPKSPGSKSPGSKSPSGGSSRTPSLGGASRSSHGGTTAAAAVGASAVDAAAASAPLEREDRRRLMDPYVSETSLIGAEFMPSVPDLGLLMDDDDDEKNYGSDLEASSDEESVAAEVTEVGGDDAVESENAGVSSHSSEEVEDDEEPIEAKRDSATNMPPPTAISSEVILSLRSSEQDPTPHQVDIPTVREFLTHVRLCTVLDEYRLVDQNFRFSSLAGMSRVGLEGFVEGCSDDAAAKTTTNKDGVNLQPAHRAIVSSLLECGDDIVVEGFVHETGSCSHGDAQDDTGTARDKAPDDRIEAAIFYSARNRQFIVVWRGPTDDQAKPVRNRHLKAAREMLARDPRSADLSSEQPVPVFPAYRDAYFKPGIEEGVFRLLDELTDRTPFCDVVMTAHSYGSALAQLAAARYASSRAQIRVCCNVFGAPKVGGVEFRHWANSLPNLKVMRIEYGSDPWVNAPEGSTWSHVGHTIVIDSSVTTLPKPAHSERVCEKETNKLHPKLGDHHHKEKDEVSVVARAYRFDQHRPQSAAKFLSYVAKSMTGHHHASKSEKNDHELSAYEYAVDRIASLGLPWMTDYVGEDTGEGVVKDEEKRMFV